MPEPFEFLDCPVSALPGHTLDEDGRYERRLVAVGEHIHQLLLAGDLTFPCLFDEIVPCMNLQQVAALCADVDYMVVIADMSQTLDKKVAECIARRFLAPEGFRVAFLVNIGPPPTEVETAFSNRISMCNGFSTGLLDALIDGLFRLTFDPGWVGIDTHDFNWALESTDKNAMAAVGFASGADPGKMATSNAIDSFNACGFRLADASGVVAMLVLNNVGLSQTKAAMNRLRDDVSNPEVPVAYSCHPVSNLPHTARVTLIASFNQSVSESL